MHVLTEYVEEKIFSWLYYFCLLLIRKTEEGTVIDFTPNDDDETSSEQQNNQPLLNSIPNTDSEQTSMISSPNGTVTGDCSQHELMADNLLPINEDEDEDDAFTSSPKPNRKMGVATAVIESKPYCGKLGNKEI